MRLPVRAGRRLRARAAGDEGISLLEVIVALSIIAVVMTSAAGFFLNGLKATGGASARQTAVDVTNQELENIRAVPGSSLLTGRTQSSVQALLAWPGAAQLTAYDDVTSAGGTPNYDPQATNSSIAAVPTVTTQTVNNQLFTMHNFIDPCWLPVGTAQTSAINNLACGSNPTPPAGQKTTLLMRVTVATSWVGGIGTNCSQGCTYSASSLVDTHPDPTFSSNLSQITITGISPSTIATGATATIVVSGAGFQYGATATTCGNATVGTINQANTTATSMQIPVTAGTTTGSCTLTITNPDGGYASTTFTISRPPTFTASSPAVQNYTSGTVTITGTNFANPTVTPSSGTWRTTGYTGTTGVTGTYAANAPTAGAVPVTITNPDGGTASGTITVTRSTPTLTLVTSASVAAGSSSTVTINGTDLAPSGATPSASAGTVSNVSTTGSSVSFTYQAPASTGSVTFTVTNPDGGSATVGASVTASRPTITGVKTTTSSTCTSWSRWGSCTGYSYTTTFTLTGTNLGTSSNVALTFYPGTQYAYAVTVSASGSSTTQTFTQSFGQYSLSGVPYSLTVTTSAGTSTPYSGTVS